MSDRRSFSEVFNARAVELVISFCRSLTEISGELGIKDGILNDWVRVWKTEHPDSVADEPDPVEWAK